MESTAATIPANSIALNDIIGIHLQRVGSGTPPAVGTVHVLDVELHYTSNKRGEAL